MSPTPFDGTTASDDTVSTDDTTSDIEDGSAESVTDEHNQSEQDQAESGHPNHEDLNLTRPGPSDGPDDTRSDHVNASKVTRRNQNRTIPEKIFRDLLNEVIKDARQGPCLDLELLAPSYVGASQWTTEEKRVLFDGLLRSGRGDLHMLAENIGTKSEFEVQAYLHMLEGSWQSSGSNENVFAVIPAAYEISQECNVLLDKAAATLIGQLNRHEAELEQAVFGIDKWLIDEATAAKIDKTYAEEPPDHVPSDVGEHETVEGNQDGTQRPAEANGVESHTAPESLLFASSFIQLSTCLFMNSQDIDSNWNRMTSTDDLYDSPAMFRSAFEDLRNLMVSFTRRLVSATLLQACSRLRATDSGRWSPSPLVRDIDVRTACRVLRIENDRKSYWATAARRCNVVVYSNSKKFYDGRVSSKNGVQLSYDEVEAEMGLDKTNSAQKHDLPEMVEIDEDETEAALNDDEIITEASSDGEDQEGDIGREKKPAPSTSKRKRKFDSDDDADGDGIAADEIADALDKSASAREEERLWAMAYSRASKPTSEEAIDVKKSIMANAVTSKKERNWRDRIRYSAEWEQPEGPVSSEAFYQTELFGSVQRKRRKRLQKAVSARLAGNVQVSNSLE